MNRKTKIIIALLVVAALIASFIYSMYSANRPTVEPDLSAGRAIQVSKEEIVIDTGTCKPDLRRVDTLSGATIIEVAGKEFDVCLLNYGPALHDRNLNQKLPIRCAVPIEREQVKFPIFNRGIDFAEIEEYCE